MWLFPIRHLHFEELSFSVNLPISFSTSNIEELDVIEFSRLFFHFATTGIHPPTQISLLFFILLLSWLLKQSSCGSSM